jgi:hypothetical protein
MLLWTGGDGSRRPTVKNIYLSLAKKKWMTVIGGWKRDLWKWDLAQKIKLFIWLSSENKILTWDSLQKKGWQGPNRCPLCLKDVETVFHIFVSCGFCQEVWLRVNKEFDSWLFGKASSLNDCLENWAKREGVYKTLPAIICWYVWLERNGVIFEGRIPSSFSVVCKVKATLPSGPPLKKIPPRNLQSPSFFPPQ